MARRLITPEVVAVGTSLLAALPIAAAIVVEHDGDVRLLARNAGFVAIRGATTLARRMLETDEPIGRTALSLFDQSPSKGMRTLRWNDGDAISGHHFLVTLSRLDDALGVRACLISLIDRTAEVAGARSLNAELVRDSLTGLPNRTAFAEAADEMAARGGGHAVLLVDLARFSRVNESLGVMAGDETIITVARRLISTLRAGDIAARVGGNEFGLLVAAADRRQAIAAAERVRRVLAAPVRLSRFEIGLECAVGCALGDGDASGEELVRHAQLALKLAKASGRVEVYSAADADGATQRLDIETELRRAIADEALSLAFQPIVDLGSDRLTGFEALARWRHPLRGAIGPNEFIAIAEETGLIVPLGHWALDHALATLAGWDNAAGRALPVSMSVNVSAIQLARDDVPTLVATLLARHGIAGERLTVELTESAIVQDPDRASRTLRALKALDVQIAMDDFGTGYSSLAYLRRLPIDILKIDRSFVTGMLADRDKVAIVRAVLSLADALGKTTTAEGVETGEVGQTLAALGCTRVQGYFHGRPMPAAEAQAYLDSRF